MVQGHPGPRTGRALGRRHLRRAGSGVRNPPRIPSRARLPRHAGDVGSGRAQTPERPRRSCRLVPHRRGPVQQAPEMAHGAGARCRGRRRGSSCRGGSRQMTAPGLLQFGAEAVRIGHVHGNRRQDGLQRRSTLICVSWESLVESLSHQHADGHSPAAGFTLEAGPAAVVDQDLQAATEHAYTLACQPPLLEWVAGGRHSPRFEPDEPKYETLLRDGTLAILPGLANAPAGRATRSGRRLW